MSDHPRPWRVADGGAGWWYVRDAHNRCIVKFAPGDCSDPKGTAALVVAAVNVMPAVEAALRGCLDAMAKVPFARMTDAGVQCGGCGATGQSDCASDCWALGLDDACDSANAVVMDLAALKAAGKEGL